MDVSSTQLQTEPAYIDINQVEPAVESDSQNQSDSHMPQENPESMEPSPETENQQVETNEQHQQPPIEIREIPPQEAQAPAEFTEVPTDPAPEQDRENPNQPDSDRQQF